MIKSEFRKLINKRLMILLAVILITNIAVVFISVPKPPADKYEIQEYIELYQKDRLEFDFKYGIIDESNDLISRNKEYYCITTTRSLFNYVNQYTEDIDSILFQAHVNKSEGTPGTFSYAYQDQIIKSYEKFADCSLPSIYVIGWDSYFSNSQQCILILIAVIVLASFIVINDYDVGINPVIHTTAKGKTSTIVGKICVTAFSVVAISLLISGTTIVSIALRSGFAGEDAPIQLIPLFEFCPFNLTIAQYALIQLLIRSIGFVLVGIIAMLISLLFKSYLLSAICILAIGLINKLTLNIQLEYKSVFAALNWWLLVDVNTPFEKLHCCRLCNNSLLIFPTALSALLILGIVIVFAIIRIQKRWVLKSNHIFLQRIKAIFENKIRAKVHYGHLFQFELKKTFHNGMIVSLCALCIIMKLYTINRAIPTPKDEIYRMYTEEFQGGMTLEKKAQIAEIRRAIDTVLSSKEATLNKYKNGEITDTEYRFFMQQYWDNYVLSEEFSKIELYATDLEESNSIGWIIYDTGYNYLFTLGLDYILCVLIFIVSYGTFYNEIKLKTDQLNGTTINGKNRLYNSKILGLIIRAIIASAFFTLMDIMTVNIKYDFASLNAPIQSIRIFNTFPADITIGQFLVLFVFLKIFYCVGYSIFVSLIGLKSKNSFTIITLTLMIVFIPHQLSNNLPALKYIDISSYLTVTPIIVSNKSLVLLFLIPCIYFAALILSLKWARKAFIATKE